MLSRAKLKLITLYRQSQSNLTKTFLVVKQNKNCVMSQFSSSCKINNNVRSASSKVINLAVRTTSNTNRGVNINKDEIISSLNFKCAEDAAPFFELPVNILYQIYRTTLNDVRNGFCENRLYYISARIQCPPKLLSERLAKRTFVYTLSFQWLEHSLNELLDKGVLGERILRDLWVLKYQYDTICERLQQIKDKGIGNLFPWMVRCSPEILNRYLKITQETKSILGDTKSTQMYLANRLNISIQEVEAICVKLPALKTIRATKLKHFLDFLINEGFSIDEIANKPRILASSPITVQKRLEQLRHLGVMDINLNLLCRSKKDYKRVVETMEAGFRDCKKS